MILISIYTLFFSALAAWCYRFGGDEHGIRWVREVGVGICLVSELIILGLFNWASLLCLGSVWIESTYFNFVQKIKEDKTWVNWLLVGLSFSVALLPWFVMDCLTHGRHWIGFSLRTVICIVFTVLWQEFISDKVAILFNTTKDITDERGRGAIQIISMPLLLI